MTDNWDINNDMQLKAALRMAMASELRDVPDPEDLDYEYEFSDNYRRNMKRIAGMAEYQYVSVGRHRLRRAVVVALVAVMLMAMTLGAVGISRILVTWNETQNEQDGTLDVTFDVAIPEDADRPFTFIQPETPDGFEIVSEKKVEGALVKVVYRNPQGEEVYYTQLPAETAALKIDNEDADFKVVKINGNKGYAVSKNGVARLVWSDGQYVFSIGGTCDIEVLWVMSESIQ